MDGTTFFAFLLPMLGALIGGTLGAYFTGYYSERGKRRATAEDIENVLAQLELHTQIAKRVESAVSHEAWGRQMLWQERKGAYSTAIEYLDEADRYYREILTHEVMGRSKEASDMKWNAGSPGGIWERLQKAERSVRICGSPEATKLLHKFIGGELWKGERSEQLAHALPDACAETRESMIHILRHDLFGE